MCISFITIHKPQNNMYHTTVSIPCYNFKKSLRARVK